MNTFYYLLQLPGKMCVLSAFFFVSEWVTTKGCCMVWLWKPTHCCMSSLHLLHFTYKSSSKLHIFLIIITFNQRWMNFNIFLLQNICKAVNEIREIYFGCLLTLWCSIIVTIYQDGQLSIKNCWWHWLHIFNLY